jgi:hypothetical protein
VITKSMARGLVMYALSFNDRQPPTKLIKEDLHGRLITSHFSEVKGSDSIMRGSLGGQRTISNL